MPWSLRTWSLLSGFVEPSIETPAAAGTHRWASAGRVGRRAAGRRAPCEHVFVTSDGSPYARFRRALAAGNLALVKATAAELPRVDLEDALEVCLLMAREDHPAF